MYNFARPIPYINQNNAASIGQEKSPTLELCDVVQELRDNF